MSTGGWGLLKDLGPRTSGDSGEKHSRRVSSKESFEADELAFGERKRQERTLENVGVVFFSCLSLWKESDLRNDLEDLVRGNSGVVDSVVSIDRSVTTM